MKHEAVTDELCTEILLVHGPLGDTLMHGEWWDQVWAWLAKRHPDMFVGSSYPYNWDEDMDDKRDMEILTAVYEWMRDGGFA